MPPLLPLSHFIGTGYVKNLLAFDASGRARAQPGREYSRRSIRHENVVNFIRPRSLIRELERIRSKISQGLSRARDSSGSNPGYVRSD